MSSSSTGTFPDLNTVMAAVGSQICSFLPLGSLLRGSDSPMLINTVFHDSLFLCLGQAEILSLSSCQHLRKIDDDQLICLIRKIIEISEASNPQYTTYTNNAERRRPRHFCSGSYCPRMTKITQLDLSRCRILMGKGVHFCLKHMPNVERILLSSAARFDATEHFVSEDRTEDDILILNKLKYVDISACRRIGGNGVKRILERCRGSSIIHLDLSGCSALMDDSATASLVGCSNIESLNLAGSNVETPGIGMLCYIHRYSLRCLNLRGCKQINLPLLLFASSYRIMQLFRDHQGEIIEGNYRHIISPNLMEIMPEQIMGYVAALGGALPTMFEVNTNFTGLLRSSQQLMDEFDRLDMVHGHGRGGEGHMFGRLEKMDLGMIGNSRIRLEGCVATIAWLNGGRLREVNLCGLESISALDISVLALSNHHLQSFSTSMNLSPDESLHLRFFSPRRLMELDLSCCRGWDSDESITGLRSLRWLRTIKLDYTNITGSLLATFLNESKQLLKLSVRGCSNVKSSSIITVRNEHAEKLRLLELDSRDIQMDCSLSKLRETYPTLLKLNNRSTPFGTKLLGAHRSDFLWRVGGERDMHVSKKRKRTTLSVPSADHPHSRCITHTSSNNCCSIQRTGFSQTSDTEQEMFNCVTCGIAFGRFMCLTCARECHKDHDVSSAGFGAGYCDCCILSTCLLESMESTIAAT